tara:strand:- start:4076 stop:4396 length:321 start_codon:yes stop_codon:yes gene_type:complete
MNYSQKANPNATNSEMDSKTIIKSSNLTNDQFGELVQQFVELQVDNMDTKTMMEWITDELIYQYGKLSNEELKERVDCFDEGLYDELVDNVTNETVLDVNNTGGKY